jgi:hypothetical protein
MGVVVFFGRLGLLLLLMLGADWFAGRDLALGAFTASPGLGIADVESGLPREAAVFEVFVSKTFGFTSFFAGLTGGGGPNSPGFALGSGGGCLEFTMRDISLDVSSSDPDFLVLLYMARTPQHTTTGQLFGLLRQKQQKNENSGSLAPTAIKNFFLIGSMHPCSKKLFSIQF